MSHLKIFRASAGSGKTYTLTGEYINILFANPNDYHKILAVTFTNKATAEMRNRILENLYQLSNPSNKNPEHLADLMKEYVLTESQARSRAKQILASLLHDYSRFSVSTIDSFFQHIVRSFAREMGLPLGFRLELQSNQIMTQAIDRVIMEMDQPNHTDLKKWLIEFAESRMEQDQGWNILREIKKLSEAVYSEVYQANATALWHELANKAQLTAYRQMLRHIILQTDQAIEKTGKQALEIITRYGLNINEDFYRKSGSPVKVFLKMDTLRSFASTQSYASLIDDVDKWYRKDNTREKNQAIENAFNKGLNQLLKDAVGILEKQGEDYFTAAAILENLNALGIVNDVSQKMSELCREKNLFLISGTNHLLSRIIDNNETPFIYEKTGTRFSHFMIDEFQDTSTLQYLNFKPLIQESLASENQTMLVGDVKQAIYRWRNSDWNLLNGEVENDYSGFGVDLRNLDTNWRSLETIIEFNNAFFPQAASFLQDAINGIIPPHLHDHTNLKPLQTKISNAYKDVVQKVSAPKINSGGYVYAAFLEGKKNETEEGIIKRVIEQIETLLQQDYQLSDICILVRTNKVGILLTNALLSGLYHPGNQPIPVISSESLLLNASEAVKLLIHQLKYLQNTSDQTLESFIRLTWFKHNPPSSDLKFDPSLVFSNETEAIWQQYKSQILKLQESPLYELTSQLTALLPSALKEHHGVYIQSFMSLLLDFINNETADLNAFIDYWDKNDEKFSLSVPENQQAIKVMTIHKSKGLEFKAVILPHFNWEILPKGSNLMWIKPQQEPFNQLTLVPVSFKKDLLNSHFAPDYLNEVLQQYVDNLNLTYVAFTRARESLSIIGSVKSREIKSFQTVADLLYFYFKTVTQGPEWNNDLLEYKKGTITRDNSKEQEQSKAIRPHSTIDSGQVNHTSIRGKVKMHLESSDYFHQEEQIRKINYGKIMHQLFENIIVEEDLETALKNMWYKGRITRNDFHHLKKSALQWLHDPRTRTWFNGSYKVKTEADILWSEQRRPDRVMMDRDEVIVVDYKFGDQKLATHQKQVRGYIDYIRKMGYQSIKGYLWYVTLGEVIEVDGQQRTLFD